MTDAPDPIQFHGGRVRLHQGDARTVLKRLEDNSVDSVVTDPPYVLESVRKRFGGKNAAPAKHGKDGSFARVSRGFMGQAWDTGDTAFNTEFWAEVLRVLKPGAHLCAFGGTRTYHRLVCAIEDAGFQIRDQLIWAHGQGFAKKGYIFKDIDKAAGVKGEIIGKGKGRTGKSSQPNGSSFSDDNYQWPGEFEIVAPATAAANKWEGWAGQLKPAIEPICLARKPLSEKTVAANVLRWSVGALNIDVCRVPSELSEGRMRHGGGVSGNGTSYELSDSHGQMPSARWPANLLHDGSEEVLACFPESQGQQGDVRGDEPSIAVNNIYGQFNGRPATKPRGDSGSAARFFASFPLTEDDKRIFYSAKADFHDRAGASHPTVKPVALLQWLVRLITPKNGVCLDPFAGTGTTAEACFREGMRCILIEREAAYIADIKRRMDLMMCGPDERSRESIKARGLTADPGPLFGGGEVKTKGREIGPTGLRK